MKIEATGNTREQAINSLDLKIFELSKFVKPKFGDVSVFGNSETGYKAVQYYEFPDELAVANSGGKSK